MEHQGFFIPRPRGVSKRALALLLQQLQVLLDASVGLVPSLEILLEQEQNLRLREALSDVCKSLVSGNTFSTGLSRHPDVFPRLVQAYINLGESCGGLPQSVKKAAEELRVASKLQSQLTSVLVYPLFSLLLAFSFLAMVLLYFVPRMAALSDGMEGGMSSLLIALVTLGEQLSSPWVLFALLQIALLMGGLFYQWRKSVSGSKAWDDLILRVPLAGAIIRRVALIRTFQGLRGLLVVGAPLLSALRLVAETLENSSLRDELLAAAQALASEGCPLHEALEQTGKYSRQVIQIVACGDASGKMVICLGRICELEQDQLDRQIEAALSLIEPAILAFLGLVVAGVTLLFFLPMTQVIGKL